ncbi:MAG: hypothetical protein E7221_01705 [Clostridiales bacterium]|nr:hypothetical protein [Clostridiales bacterium]MBQ3322980.1 hypothetical protein [Bacillota bacterium]
MRTNEERIAAMHARANELNREERVRKVRIMQSAGAAIAVAATIMLAVFLPKINEFEPDTVVGSGDMHASILNDSGSTGYVVIAIIAFLFGVAATMFCYRVREWQERKGSMDSDHEGQK